MSQKRARTFRRMFGQPDGFNLLDVPEDAVVAPNSPPETNTTSSEEPSESPPSSPLDAELPDDHIPPSLSLTETSEAADAPPPPAAAKNTARVSASPAPPEVDAPHSTDSGVESNPTIERWQSVLNESPTEPLPKHRKSSVPSSTRITPPHSVPERVETPTRSAHQIRRKPRAPGALRGIGPAEKGAQLLKRIRAGESIHNHPFFDAHLAGASLHGADLSCGQLQRVDFSGADLRGADMRESDLRGANLSQADLRGADMRGCRLELVRLEGADLRQANLSDLLLATSGLMNHADLRGANLSGTELSATMSGARVDLHTYMASSWTPAHLVKAHQIGMIIDEIERFPRLARAEIVGIEGGMTLQFSTPLSFQDRFVLQGLIAAVLGPDCGCHLDELSGNRLLLTAVPQSNLTEVAEFLSTRMWERGALDENEQALLSQLERLLPTDFLRNELSFLVDRLTSITLQRAERTPSWRLTTEPLDALRHLLLKLFIPVELRWWLAVLPNGKELVRGLPKQETTPEAVVHAALAALSRHNRIDIALFRSLIDERQRQGAEIRAVAALWGVDLR